MDCYYSREIKIRRPSSRVKVTIVDSQRTPNHTRIILMNHFINILKQFLFMYLFILEGGHFVGGPQLFKFTQHNTYVSRTNI